MERAIQYLTGSWWTSARVAGTADAQRDLDRWCERGADQRLRADGHDGDERRTVAAIAAREPLRALPAGAYPAVICVERQASRKALVAHDGNRYSIDPAHAGRTVTVIARVGEPTMRVIASAGEVIGEHRLAVTGAGQTIRTREHAQALEQAVLAAFHDRQGVLAQGQPAAVRHVAGRPGGHPRPRRPLAGAGVDDRVRPARGGLLIMLEHRYDAHAEIVPDEHELLIGANAQLMRLVLTDDGPLTDALTGEHYTTADVFCHLTADQARQLADRLHALADQLATAIL